MKQIQFVGSMLLGQVKQAVFTGLYKKFWAKIAKPP